MPIDSLSWKWLSKIRTYIPPHSWISHFYYAFLKRALNLYNASKLFQGICRGGSTSVWYSVKSVKFDTYWLVGFCQKDLITLETFVYRIIKPSWHTLNHSIYKYIKIGNMQWKHLFNTFFHWVTISQIGIQDCKKLWVFNMKSNW